MLTYDMDSDTYQAHTRRYERARGILRDAVPDAHIVVPDWPTLSPSQARARELGLTITRKRARRR
jgi:hypothetical protein